VEEKSRYAATVSARISNGQAPGGKRGGLFETWMGVFLKEVFNSCAPAMRFGGALLPMNATSWFGWPTLRFCGMYLI
jgi:hypothetical protein